MMALNVGDGVGHAIAGGKVILPAMALRSEAIRHNLAVMSNLAAKEHFEIAPHGKTTMCPELFKWQLEAGAWGLTVANVRQAQVAVEAGATHIMVANQVVGAADAAWLARTAVSLDVLSLVDSVAGVSVLDEDLRHAGFERALPVLIEIGVCGGRTGVRSLGAAREVAYAVERSRRLELVGVEGYEGSVGSDRSAQTLAAVDQYLDSIRRATVCLADEDMFGGDRPIIVSAGGSKYFDRVIRILGRDADFSGHSTALVLRSGCYVVHDHGIYANTSPLGAEVPEGERLQPAIEVWAEVLSSPEPGLIIVGLGRRDASFDSGLPVPLEAVSRSTGLNIEGFEGRLVKLDDQHGYLVVDRATCRLQVGDRLAFGVSHPCTTFDKWRDVHLLDSQGRVEQILHTSFH